MSHFLARIRQMNETFGVPINDKPTDLGIGRIEDFDVTIKEEVKELNDLKSTELTEEECLVGLADWLGDMIVYCASEALKWGIPIGKVLDAIMDSQKSKLVDGKPILNERGKFIKGPNYQPPEPAIRKILFGEES